jgi:hypothetical protein
MAAKISLSLERRSSKMRLNLSSSPTQEVGLLGEEVRSMPIKRALAISSLRRLAPEFP